MANFTLHIHTHRQYSAKRQQKTKRFITTADVVELLKDNVGLHWHKAMDWIGLSSVLRTRPHSIWVIWETVFTGQKTQPTVSQY